MGQRIRCLHRRKIECPAGEIRSRGVQIHQLLQRRNIDPAPSHLVRRKTVGVFEQEVLCNGRCGIQRALQFREVVALAAIKACGNIEQQGGCGVPRLRTGRRRSTSKKQALQTFELQAVGFRDPCRIAPDAAGNRCSRTFTIGLAHPG